MLGFESSRGRVGVKTRERRTCRLSWWLETALVLDVQLLDVTVTVS